MHLFSNSKNTKQCSNLPACGPDATYNELPGQRSWRCI